MTVSVGKAAVPTKGLTTDVGASNKNPHADTALAIADTAKQNAGKTAVVVDKEVAVAVRAAAPAASNIALEIVGHARLWYNGILYEAGVVYQHSRDYAEHLLSLVGIKSLPLFKISIPAKARPTTPAGKPVVNLAAVKTKTSNAVPEPAVPNQEQSEHAGAAAQGVDLGEDDIDPELAAHLAAAEAAGQQEQQGEQEQHATV